MNPFSTLAENESVAFAWVLVSVPAVVLLVAMLMTFYALYQKRKGNLAKNEEHTGIIQNLYQNGESTGVVMQLARTTEMVLFYKSNNKNR